MSKLLHAFDLPAIHRFGVGFDHLANLANLMDHAQTSVNYPPHNVVKTSETEYTIELAVAGFLENEISVELKDQLLTITGSRQRDNDSAAVYLHQGLALRDFTRQFTLSDNVEVRGAVLKNGILSVHLEKLLPKQVPVNKIAIRSE